MQSQTYLTFKHKAGFSTGLEECWLGDSRLNPRLIKNVTIVVFLFCPPPPLHAPQTAVVWRLKAVTRTSPAFTHSHRLYSSTILEGTSGSDLGSIWIINRDDEKSWKIKESSLKVFSAQRVFCLHPWRYLDKPGVLWMCPSFDFCLLCSRMSLDWWSSSTFPHFKRRRKLLSCLPSERNQHDRSHMSASPRSQSQQKQVPFKSKFVTI